MVLNRSGTIDVSDLPLEVRAPRDPLVSGVEKKTESSGLLQMPYKEAKRQFEIDYQPYGRPDWPAPPEPAAKVA